MVQTGQEWLSIPDKTFVMTGALHTPRRPWFGRDFKHPCAIGAVQSLPADVYVAKNVRIWDPAKIRKSVAANRFEAA